MVFFNKNIDIYYASRVPNGEKEKKLRHLFEERWVLLMEPNCGI